MLQSKIASEIVVRFAETDLATLRQVVADAVLNNITSVPPSLLLAIIKEMVDIKILDQAALDENIPADQTRDLCLIQGGINE